MPEMVWCEKCKTVVWACDHQKPVDLRGMMNMLRMPCPECGSIGCFDGWSCRGEDIPHLAESYPENVYDEWSALHYVADIHKVAWEPSPNFNWWRRPDSSDLSEDIAALVKRARWH